MSDELAVRRALEGALVTLATTYIAVADNWFENTKYIPVDNTAYQRTWIIFAEPENPSLGDNYHRLRGYMQVDLHFPQDVGPANAYNQAKLIKDKFARGSSFTASGITTKVERTPAIGQGRSEGDRYILTVKVRFYAEIFV